MSVPDWLVAKPIAHRGLHDKSAGIIENSPAAARAAIARGFPIECDVQLTRDGEAVVFHDYVLDRLTAGTGRVDEHTAAQITALTLTGSAVDDKVPTLPDFLALLAGRVPLVLEIKSRFEGDLRLTERTAAVVDDYPGPVVLKSFDPMIVTALRRLAPRHARGIIGENRYEHGEYSKLPMKQKHAMANLLHFGESRPDFLSWQVADLESAAPYLCRVGMGLPVMTWTVRTPEQRAMARSGADQMVFEGFLP